MTQLTRYVLKIVRAGPELRRRMALRRLAMDFKGLHGLEIGGPSDVFKPGHLLPVYQWAKRVDNVNFASTTTWQDNLEPGATFRFHSRKAPGQQYICEGSDLSQVDTPAFDFILSSHTLEHMANPLKALLSYRDKLKDNGRLLTILPHKEGTFDHRRPVTALAHLLDDLEQHTDESDLTHLPEILALHDLTLDPAAGDLEAFKTRSLQNEKNRCLHQHVFHTELVLRIYDHLGLRIEHVLTAAPFHIVVVGRKNPAGIRPDNRFWLAADARWRKDSPFMLDKIPYHNVEQAVAGTVFPTPQNTCSIMITYHPDQDVPVHILQVLPQVSHMILVDNGSLPTEKDRLKEIAATHPNLEFIELPDNLGIATALNQGLERALALGFEWALTFDQDSRPDADLFAHLAHLIRIHPLAHLVKVMGAKFIDTETDMVAFAQYNSLLGHNTVAAVITSGALMSLRAYCEIGPFRDDFFIDMVDLEYCLRLRAHGYHVGISSRPLMRHSCGRHSLHILLGRKFLTTNHTPLRKYYITRNRLVMERKFLFKEPAWALNDAWLAFNDALKILFFEGQKADKIRAIRLGFWHALIGRMGKLDETRYRFLASPPPNRN